MISMVGLFALHNQIFFKILCFLFSASDSKKEPKPCAEGQGEEVPDIDVKGTFGHNKTFNNYFFLQYQIQRRNPSHMQKNKEEMCPTSISVVCEWTSQNSVKNSEFLVFRIRFHE